MKTKIAAALLALAVMLTTACEEHKWSETSKLFKSHDEHGAGHAKEGEQGKAEAHGEKKAEGHGEAAKH